MASNEIKVSCQADYRGLRVEKHKQLLDVIEDDLVMVAKMINPADFHRQ